MSGHTPTFTKSFLAAAAIEGHLIIAASGDGRSYQVATSSTDALLAAAGSLGAPAGGMVDVDLGGIGEVRFGGAVDHMDPLTSDANGRAVVAVPIEGEIVRIIGFALCDAAAGDIGPYLIAPGVLATPAAA